MVSILHKKSKENVYVYVYVYRTIITEKMPIMCVSVCYLCLSQFRNYVLLNEDGQLNLPEWRKEQQ